ncbi:MAG: flagellar hook-associated protein FlgK [Isosphaera sp.]|nr:flagellar hook-associated protein FlgK [Isosphaera sp.]
MNAFAIGTSAINVGQKALDLIGQNIANAATPGYNRQAANLTSRVVGGSMGVGVDVASVTRFEFASARAAILRANGDQASDAVRLDARRQVEANLGSGTGGIGDGLENFFNQVTRLTSRPDDLASRRPVVAAAADLAGRFNATAGELDRFRGELGGQVRQSVDQVNDLTTRIADLNVRIANVVQAGNQPNDLIDQRGQLVDDLSKLVDVRVIPQPFNVVNVLSAGAALVVGEFPVQFSLTATGAGTLVVTEGATARVVNFASGKLAGQLQEFNTDLPATRARLDALAGEFVRRVNQVQATGLGTAGPLAATTGSVGVADPAAALSTQNLPFALGTGPLTISVTDTATGNRTNTAIAIDPSQSLNQVVAGLAAVPGLAASVGPGNVLQITAQPGFRFDFAGRDTNPPGGGPVANSDPAGFLSALGVNGLFTGTNAASITLRPDIAADPGLLAASRTGTPGDATNLERFAAVRDQAVFAGRTLTAEFADQLASVGSDVDFLGDQQDARAALVQNLSAQEQGVVGVNLNEELLNLLSFQRMIEGASKYLSAVNTALDSILTIVD